MEVKLVTSIKDDFSDAIGPSQTKICFLSIDGKLFHIGTFYEGPHMDNSSIERLNLIIEFGKRIENIEL